MLYPEVGDKVTVRNGVMMILNGHFVYAKIGSPTGWEVVKSQYLNGALVDRAGMSKQYTLSKDDNVKIVVTCYAIESIEDSEKQKLQAQIVEAEAVIAKLRDRAVALDI